MHTCVIGDRFHKMIFNVFYYVAFRKIIYQHGLLQKYLDVWVDYYNDERAH